MRARRRFGAAVRRHQSDEIAAVFSRCRKERRAAFIPYICAGDPSLGRTVDLLEALVAGGADLIELGVPFSDPIADGPTIQRATTRALAAGTTLSAILQIVAESRPRLGVPIVLFSYFNPIHNRGVATFADQAASSGVDGLLCVDLPPEEAVAEAQPALLERGIDPIFLLAPTSTPMRIKIVAKASRGFVYYVARTGVTGERERLPEELVSELARLRKIVKLPVAVGFGISSAEQVAQVASVADGVVVGSALVRLIEEQAASENLASIVEARTRELSEAVREGWMRGAESQ